ncbi:TPA: hypothetical protein HA235_06255 [Candidatus Woesearchaeota archaeon]|nr:hypothetical protein [uncultured archaeon]MBS3173739.1 hypothetical protein [Candidatus Woesearchaeota archaeon]AQS33723.1 hypothetical protein [uncultured archaeon]HIH32283.1 hypothetical protein [Candidatus Woesearchaeota archaeon]HIH54558.1 hypothetical protein [Candidatus Woesearchaeota archaeon]
MITPTYALLSLKLDSHMVKNRFELQSRAQEDNPTNNPSGWTTVKPSKLENMATYTAYKVNIKTGRFDPVVYYKKN